MRDRRARRSSSTRAAAGSRQAGFPRSPRRSATAAAGGAAEPRWHRRVRPPHARGVRQQRRARTWCCWTTTSSWSRTPAAGAAFSRTPAQPTLVGGQMLSLQDASAAHHGRGGDRRTYLWRNAPDTESDHDFGEGVAPGDRELHRRVDVDHNGWWMCMVPGAAWSRRHAAAGLHQVGRRGVRAARPRPPATAPPPCPASRSGTCRSWRRTTPGDWQAYFHYRNRLVAAALHGPDNPRAILVDIFKRTLRAPDALWSTRPWRCRRWRCGDFLAGPDGAVRQHRARSCRRSASCASPTRTRRPCPSARRAPGAERSTWCARSRR